MSSRRTRVDGLNEDLSALSRKVEQLYGDLEAVVEEIETDDEQGGNRTDGGNESRTSGGQVGWKEIETAGRRASRQPSRWRGHLWKRSGQPTVLISTR